MNFAANKKRRQSAIRLAALFLCVLFLAAALFSEIFILTRLHHEHDHGGPDGCCAVCAHMQTAVKLLNQLSALPIAATLLGGFWGVSALFKPIASLQEFFTLITLKVRMNN